MSKEEEVNFLLIINITGLIYWFIKFPTFRYGKSYIVCTLIILFIYFINFIFKKEYIEKKFFKIILAFCFVVILTKNFKRVYLSYTNEYLNYPFPEIYSLNSIGKIENHIPFIKFYYIHLSLSFYYYLNQKDLLIHQDFGQHFDLQFIF